MFDLPDELFVSEAYLRVLGRPADPAGYAGYLRGLRGRLSRARIVADLQASEEAQRGNGALAGRAPTTVPALWPGARGERCHGIDGTSQRDLLAVRGDLFIDCSFAALLRRRPSADERKHWLDQLRTDTDKSSMLAALRRTPEFRRRASPFGWWRARGWPGGPTSADLNNAQASTPVIEKVLSAGTHSAGIHRLSGKAVFTIASRSYLPYVRTLMASVREQHPDYHRVLLLADAWTELEPRDTELFYTVGASEIGIDSFDDMTLRYDVVEFSTALKPHFFRWLFRHTELTSAIYLDPDIRLYGKLEAVEKLLDAHHSLVLTPHITAPLSDDREPSDHTILKSGVFNLGFIAASRSEEADRFIAWWADKLRTGAVVDLSQNLFTDQRWCDFAPALVPSLAVLRHSGYNAAYWNMGQRELRRDADHRWLADGHPLAFFHFSGINPDRPSEVSKYQNRFHWDDLATVQSLFTEYASELRANGWESARRCSYAYDRVSTVPLPPLLRRLYRHRHPQPCGLTREEGMRELVSLCVPERDKQSPPGFGLSALMRFVYDLRVDLAREFDLRDPGGRRDFAGWFWSTAVAEYGLGELLLSVRRSQTASG